MSNLIEALTAEDFENLFERIHASIALIEKNGEFSTWNKNFESYKELLKKALPEKLTEMHWVENVESQDSELSRFDCFLIPASNGRFILLADPATTDLASTHEVEKLQRQVKLFQIESEFSKKLAQNKQIELESVVIQAKEVAQTDHLTYILNRRAIINELQNEVTRAERYNSQLSVSIIDVDHFKSINDSFGHAVGDKVLQKVAQCLRDGIRHPDIVGRYGGEEFIIILPSSDSIAASEQASRLVKQMRETLISIKEHNIQVTLSIGVAELKTGIDTWDTLLNRADNAMYKAKKKGRDRWEVSA